jgi:hypothetical protein
MRVVQFDGRSIRPEAAKSAKGASLRGLQFWSDSLIFQKKWTNRRPRTPKDPAAPLNPEMR